MTAKQVKWLKMLGIALLVYLFFVAVVFVNQRDFLYFPFGTERPDIAEAPWMSIAEVQTADGLQLQGWYQQPIGENKPVVLFFHGNGHNISVRLPKSIVFLKNHYGLLLAEYRGYGGNPGSPSKEGLFMDGRAYMNWLLKEQQIKPENIVLYGESLGAAVALKMANEYGVKAVVLEVPFNRIVDVAQMRFFFIPFLGVLMQDDYDNVEEIQKLQNTPVFIGLASKDLVIPKRFGQKLFDAAHEPKQLIDLEEAGHNSMYKYGFGDRVIEFIESLEALPQNDDQAIEQ